MKTIVLAAIMATVVSIGSAVSPAQPVSFAWNPPAYNYHQNNWMRG